MMSAFLIAAALQSASISAEEAAPLATVQAMLDALGNRDKEAMAATLLPTATATHVADGKVRQFPMTDFLATIKPSPQKFEEPIYDPLVRVDGDLAFVWAAYDFRIDGKIHHCGTDLIDLVRVEGQWKIASIAWNQRSDCPAR
ncbi:nuclear transport factor 2 family protein [Sphingosinicella rhizophila]|uniref:Nuclear transport factor 2 family protein n=1 Tax=Sphingosinicella rhizophila TaxID=3050082 RepID=A0ABU3Q1Y8_9SPHN|nr:nuclear transport factor 2 family protein [Sphingosinicella sp. GR2756]MDT9597438.1 nuclear transport factor 2 family protein [Sphingosinicella sp. GR2756]